MSESSSSLHQSTVAVPNRLSRLANSPSVQNVDMGGRVSAVGGADDDEGEGGISKGFTAFASVPHEGTATSIATNKKSTLTHRADDVGQSSPLHQQHRVNGLFAKPLFVPPQQQQRRPIPPAATRRASRIVVVPKTTPAAAIVTCPKEAAAYARCGGEGRRATKITFYLPVKRRQSISEQNALESAGGEVGGEDEDDASDDEDGMIDDADGDARKSAMRMIQPYDSSFVRAVVESTSVRGESSGGVLRPSPPPPLKDLSSSTVVPHPHNNDVNNADINTCIDGDNAPPHRVMSASGLSSPAFSMRPIGEREQEIVDGGGGGASVGEVEEDRGSPLSKFTSTVTMATSAERRARGEHEQQQRQEEGHVRAAPAAPSPQAHSTDSPNSSSITHLIGNLQKILNPSLWITDDVLMRHHKEKAATLDAFYDARRKRMDETLRRALDEVKARLEGQSTANDDLAAQVRDLKLQLAKEREMKIRMADAAKSAEQQHTITAGLLEGRIVELETLCEEQRRRMMGYETALLAHCVESSSSGDEEDDKGISAGNVEDHSDSAANTVDRPSTANRNSLRGSRSATMDTVTTKAKKKMSTSSPTQAALMMGPAAAAAANATNTTDNNISPKSVSLFGSLQLMDNAAGVVPPRGRPSTALSASAAPLSMMSNSNFNGLNTPPSSAANNALHFLRVQKQQQERNKKHSEQMDAASRRFVCLADQKEAADARRLTSHARRVAAERALATSQRKVVELQVTVEIMEEGMAKFRKEIAYLKKHGGGGDRYGGGGSMGGSFSAYTIDDPSSYVTRTSHANSAAATRSVTNGGGGWNSYFGSTKSIGGGGPSSVRSFSATSAAAGRKRKGPAKAHRRRQQKGGDEHDHTATATSTSVVSAAHTFPAAPPLDPLDTTAPPNSNTNTTSPSHMKSSLKPQRPPTAPNNNTKNAPPLTFGESIAELLDTISSAVALTSSSGGGGGGGPHTMTHDTATRVNPKIRRKVGIAPPPPRRGGGGSGEAPPSAEALAAAIESAYQQPVSPVRSGGRRVDGGGGEADSPADGVAPTVASDAKSQALALLQAVVDGNKARRGESPAQSHQRLLLTKDAAKHTAVRPQEEEGSNNKNAQQQRRHEGSGNISEGIGATTAPPQTSTSPSPAVGRPSPVLNNTDSDGGDVSSALTALRLKSLEDLAAVAQRLLDATDGCILGTAGVGQPSKKSDEGIKEEAAKPKDAADEKGDCSSSSSSSSSFVNSLVGDGDNEGGRGRNTHNTNTSDDDDAVNGNLFKVVAALYLQIQRQQEAIAQYARREEDVKAHLRKIMANRKVEK